MTMGEHTGIPGGMQTSTLECQNCAYQPAAPVKLWKITGMVILWRRTWYTGPYCQACARGLFRDCQDHNLKFGWWGIAAFIANIFVLIMNVFKIRKHDQIGPPSFRRPDAVSPSFQPNPGRPLIKRPGALIVGSLALLALAFVVLSAIFAGGTDESGAVGSCFTDDGVSVHCDNGKAAWKVTNQVTNKDDCDDYSFVDPDDSTKVACVVKLSAAATTN